MVYIGVDLGGTKIAAGVVDGRGNILCKDSAPTPTEQPGAGCRGRGLLLRDERISHLRISRQWSTDLSV